MWEKQQKKKFFPQSEPHLAKLCFSVVLKYFWGKSQRTSLFIQKIGSQKRALKNSESFFFYMFEKGKILRNIWICLNKCFFIKLVKGDKY